VGKVQGRHAALIANVLLPSSTEALSRSTIFRLTHRATNLCLMHVLRKFLALALAVTLTASLVGRSAIAAGSGAPCGTRVTSTVTPSHPHAHSSHEGRADQLADHRHHLVEIAQDSDEEQGPANATAAKCCGLCTSPPSVPLLRPTLDAERVATDVSYPLLVTRAGQRLLLIDPGIPKRIA
jgi:hypothetical protein